MRLAWNVIPWDEVDDRLLALAKEEPRIAENVVAAVDRLESIGPTPGRPLVDVISGSRIHNLKELRLRSAEGSAIRILFVFDPERQAVLLVAGDKAGRWKEWYDKNIPLAEDRYRRWPAGGYGMERG